MGDIVAFPESDLLSAINQLAKDIKAGRVRGIAYVTAETSGYCMGYAGSIEPVPAIGTMFQLMVDISRHAESEADEPVEGE
jgi:hypothetical protein